MFRPGCRRDYRPTRDRVKEDPHGWRQFAREIEEEVKRLEDAGVEIKPLPEMSPARLSFMFSMTAALVVACAMGDAGVGMFVHGMVPAQLSVMGDIARFILCLGIGVIAGVACLAGFMFYDYNFHNDK